MSKGNPKATKHPEKDLSAIGKASWDRGAESNRGNCPKPKGWDENTTKAGGCLK